MTLLAAPAPVVHPGRGDLLDLVLIALVIRAGMVGARRGLVVAACSAAGFFVGAWLGTQIGPGLAQAVVRANGSGPDGVLGRRLVTLVLVAVFALLGETFAVTVGLRIRRLLRASPVAVLDSAGGAVFEMGVLLLVAWLLASAVALAPFDGLSTQVRRSAVLDGINSLIPQSLRNLSATLTRELQQHAMPYFLSPFGGFPAPSPFVGAPDAGPVPQVLGESGSSVVKIHGVAASCGRAVEGSGFVYAPGHVMTNAHVVAGVSAPTVLIPNGGSLAARVVLYDPDRDIAVLYVPGLERKPLNFAGSQTVGADAVVAGYPEDGPLTPAAARIAGDQSVTGPNIYQTKNVTRDVYTIRAKVLPGNSGGPLLTTSGTVAGVVFAASLDASDVGYALTAAEVASDAHAGADATTAVSTHGCD
ncbi:MAG TPA: MarP family serine protease [Sporichthyaceae bacterium]|jgi:S1-C subfamily serine protease|nr:MarP family serine protease [Sporichthyaceae bacterium]